MNANERLVWAAAYATFYARELGLNSGDNHAAAVSAIEDAGYAVECMRETRDRVRDGFEGWGFTLPMLDEMLEKP